LRGKRGTSNPAEGKTRGTPRKKRLKGKNCKVQKGKKRKVWGYVPRGWGVGRKKYSRLLWGSIRRKKKGSHGTPSTGESLSKTLTRGRGQLPKLGPGPKVPLRHDA